MARHSRGAKAASPSKMSEKPKQKGKGGSLSKRASAHGTKSRGNRTLPFPEEVLPLIYPFLTWRDTYRVRGVSRSWQTAYRASLEHASLVWTSQVFQGESWDEILGKLQAHEQVFETPTLPHLAWVIASGQPHSFRRMSGWQKLLDVVTQRNLLPVTCNVVCAYSDAGLIGYNTNGGVPPTELESDTIDGNMALAITVGHLPGTSLTLALPEKDEINAILRAVQAGAGTSASLGLPRDTSSVVVLSTNGRQSANLLRGLHFLHPSLESVVGALVHFTDRCVPLVYRNATYNPTNRTWQNHLVQTTNLLVGFSGRVRAAPFVSLGFEVCSPILQCAGVVEEEHFHLLHMYDAVHTAENPTRPVHPLDVMRLPPPQGSLHLFVADSAATLESFVVAPSPTYSENAAGLTCIECMYDIDKHILFSQSSGDLTIVDYWPVGAYGVFCTQTAAAARHDFIASLKQVQDKVAAEGGQAIGALTFPCAARGAVFYDVPNAEGDLFHAEFPSLPLTGVFAGGEIGPMALPGGTCAAASTQLQQFTTCGAVFYST
ncbi:hypothetical protein H310_05816 [Aphanomyces invadans]|uniref:FIST C-domain domain-containing protein n=1 Tax=Aphanomyces invadans TaxID=157072 RepID=A0A024U7R1_9STRA|nr:hypothetical protein H310_05816 [Aphanomyces invadans]ETW02265.1 hypothetical protein H310_05816 [Aphanomyces invadans]|eukprot:XP_008868870.1 hypothetical protein H310_05816 [Aphanomyces invadans]